MAIDSKDLQNFGDYLFTMYDEIYASDIVYKAKISEERTNGKIDKVLIEFEREK